MFFRKKTILDKTEDFLAEHHLGRRHFHWLKFFGLALASILVLILILGAPLIVSGLKTLHRINALDADFSRTITAVEAGNWQIASVELRLIRDNLAGLNNDLRHSGIIVYAPPFNKNIKAIGQLLDSADDLLAGYERIFNVLKNVEQDFAVQNIVLGFKDAKQRQALLKSLRDGRADFVLAEKNIQEAENKLTNINTDDLSSIFQDKLLAADQILAEAVNNTEIALPILSNLSEILGYNQEKNYLFVFQNNMEMRPTGGFIGSYGIITLKDGEIKNVFTDDIYNLDKLSQSKLNVPAPAPMAKYNNQKTWFLRDANWSPDWPTSAEQILWFFNEERKNANLPPQKIDAVIALTPDFIANLLEVIGPVVADGENFSAQNFANDLEQFVEFDYANKGVSKDERKAVIGVLTNLIITRAHQLPALDLLRLWLAFKKNIDAKHILVYFTDAELQKYFYQKNWSGMMKQTAGDYLMVVDSNLAALKTDSVMDKSISYNLRVDEKGDLIAHLELTYKHNGRHLSGFITRYRDYVRIYTPKDTWFIKSYVRQGDQVTDLKILSDLEIYNELDKKVAAAFLTIEPGETKILVLEYRLGPEFKTQYENGTYTFSVQKQPGTIGHNLRINLNFNRPISAYNADSFPAVERAGEIGWDAKLDMDKEYLIKF